MEPETGDTEFEEEKVEEEEDAGKLEKVVVEEEDGGIEEVEDNVVTVLVSFLVGWGRTTRKLSWRSLVSV